MRNKRWFHLGAVGWLTTTGLLIASLSYTFYVFYTGF